MLDKKQIEVLDSIGILDGFRYFSGYDGRNHHNCPTIYTVGGNFYIVGPGFQVECENFKEATNEYQKFLNAGLFKKKNIR